jgi:uncharacterized protein YecE (DUF72 family)
MIVVATAGWSIPRAQSRRFPGAGTHLQRYAGVLRGVEINTSFYRDHTPDTYARWARQTPRTFRFAVKVPQLITHEQRLRAARRPLEDFLEGIRGLGRRLGPLVVQLPPSLAFELRVATRFFVLLRERHAGPVVCEPRHASWFVPRAGALLADLQVGRVAADPAVVPAAAVPGGWPGIAYFRLHGSPRKYWSAYDPARLSGWASRLMALPRATPAWIVLDNTASGAAAGNALQVLRLLGAVSRPRDGSRARLIR